MVAVSRDISDRKQAEKALEESRQQMVNILESITDAFWALDRQWRFRFMNSQGEKILSRSQSELMGQNIWEMFPESVGFDFGTSVTEGSSVTGNGRICRVLSSI